MLDCLRAMTLLFSIDALVSKAIIPRRNPGMQAGPSMGTAYSGETGRMHFALRSFENKRSALRAPNF